MALTTLTVAAPARDGTAAAAAEALSSADTYIMFAAPKAGKFIIEIENASSSAPVFVALSGTGNHAGLGNKSFTVAAATGTQVQIGPLSTSRFKSASGSTNWINISMPTVCTTGKMWVVKVP